MKKFMKYLDVFIFLTAMTLVMIISLIATGCSTGNNSETYSTLFGDITIVDNGGTANTSKTTSNAADLDVANKAASNIVRDKLNKKIKNN